MWVVSEDNMPWSDGAEPLQITLPVFQLEFNLTYDVPSSLAAHPVALKEHVRSS